jgi:Na+/H+ antiporter NhaD/arsenite permease-like protein
MPSLVRTSCIATLGYFKTVLCAAVLMTFSAVANAAGAGPEPLLVAGIPFDFILFAFTLLGVAVFSNQTFYVALVGLAAITAYKVFVTGFKFGTGLTGLIGHMQHEWVTLANLFLLLMGFALLARHFEKSGVPDIMPRYLPDDWKGAFFLLVIVFVISSFLDNIAAALIGGAMAIKLFRKKVHTGYVAAIVAASNAGGSGSVVGDTTTTMMWIDGVSPVSVLDAYVAATVALVVCGIPAAIQQHRYSPIMKDEEPGHPMDWTRVFIVLLILATAILANVYANLNFKDLLDSWPIIGLGVWAAILVTVPLRRPDWNLIPENFKGTVFLLALVTCASMMPVEKLPSPSWETALGLGFLSAVFDNIPLTALALKQGGHDWGFLAYAVGFGGSMIWFGSSAGVGIVNMFPESRNAFKWLIQGWHVTLGYVVGFFVMLAILGWKADKPHKRAELPPQTQSQSVMLG